MQDVGFARTDLQIMGGGHHNITNSVELIRRLQLVVTRWSGRAMPASKPTNAVSRARYRRRGSGGSLTTTTTTTTNMHYFQKPSCILGRAAIAKGRSGGANRDWPIMRHSNDLLGKLPS